jgi:hypothetical protein
MTKEDEMAEKAILERIKVLSHILIDYYITLMEFVPKGKEYNGKGYLEMQSEILKKISRDGSIWPQYFKVGNNEVE